MQGSKILLLGLLCVILVQIEAQASRKDTLVHFTGKAFENKIDTDKKITYKNAIYKLVKTSVGLFLSNTAKEVTVKCFAGDSLVAEQQIKDDGTFTFELLYDYQYKIKLLKEGYYLSEIELNTAGVPKRMQKKGSEVYTEVDIIKKEDGFNEFDFPMSKIYFDEKSAEFVHDEEHAIFVHSELERIRIELTKQLLLEKEVGRLSEQAKTKLFEDIEQQRAEAKSQADLIVSKARFNAQQMLKSTKDSLELLKKFYDKQIKEKIVAADTLTRKIDKVNVALENQEDLELLMSGGGEIIDKKEKVENARKLLELAKLKATTKMDSLLIIEREAKILAAENKILMSEQKLRSAKKELDTKNMQLEKEELKRKALFFSLSLFLVLVVVLYRSIKRKKEDNKIILQKKLEIEEQHKEITDSIHYAQRIQSAVLTSETEWEKIGKQHMVLFKPRDVVSGDFFWAHHNDQLKLSIWATADCTGHGVPGAFMSMLGIGFLNEIIIENKVIKPDEILNNLRQKIINALDTNNAKSSQKDGMDISLCVLHHKTNTLEYAGANNPIWILKPQNRLSNQEREDSKTLLNHEKEKAIIELKPDKQPVGLFADKLDPFSCSTVNLHAGDVVVSFTDGYPDQFGGEKGKKLKYKPFKNFFLQDNYASLSDLKKNLDKAFYDWKGDLDQVDDVCVIAVQV